MEIITVLYAQHPGSAVRKAIAATVNENHGIALAHPIGRIGRLPRRPRADPDGAGIIFRGRVQAEIIWILKAR